MKRGPVMGGCGGAFCSGPRYTFQLLSLALIFGLGGCLGSTPECGGVEVKRTIADLFRKQFKLTPYVRFIDFDRSELDVEAVFDVKQEGLAKFCVAFVRYKAKLNDEGEKAERSHDLTYSLLYELANEKQVYYRVSQTADGGVKVQIERVGG